MATVATADGPLELYVVLDRANVGYARVEAGKPFEVAAERTAETHVVRVDLVQGASIWHREEQIITH